MVEDAWKKVEVLTSRFPVTQTGGPLGVPSALPWTPRACSEQDPRAALAQHAGTVAPAPEPERSYPAELGYTVRVEPDDHPPVEASYTVRLRQVPLAVARDC